IETINPDDFAVGSVNYLSPFAINEERKLQRTLTTVITSIQPRGPMYDVTIATTTQIETFNPIFRIKAVLTAEMPPVVIPENPVYPEGPKADWPICRVRILPTKSESIYLFLRQIKIKKIEITMNVEGL